MTHPPSHQNKAASSSSSVICQGKAAYLGGNETRRTGNGGHTAKLFTMQITHRAVVWRETILTRCRVQGLDAGMVHLASAVRQCHLSLFKCFPDVIDTDRAPAISQHRVLAALPTHLGAPAPCQNTQKTGLLLRAPLQQLALYRFWWHRDMSGGRHGLHR